MHQSFDNSKRSVTDRNISPFQGPQPVNSSSYPLRNQEVNVSRGIFSSKKENAQSEIITPRTKTDQARILPGSYAQVLKEFLDNDLQAQITQFRNEMIKVMNESLRDFNEKSNRNHETISAIKESIKNHGNNIDVLDQKIEEYHLSLNTIGELFQSEIEKIKQNLPSHRGSYQESKRRTGENLNPQQDQRFQKLERQQKDLLASFERLKEELTESIQIGLQDYGHVSEKDTNDRVNQISNEIAQNMEQKIEKVLNHLDAKVLVLEKQIQTYGRPDDAIVDNLKFQMEDKINEQTLSIRQQIQNLYQMIEAKPDDSQLRTGSALGGELDQRIDQTRDELAVLRSELGSIIEQVRSNSKSLNAKLEDYERKFNEECNQLRKQKASAGSSQNYDALERKIGSIEGHFDEIHHEQMNLANDISIQKAQLDSFKTTAAVNFSDIKTSQTEMGDIRLKKLEQLVDQLSKTVETLKPGLTDSTSSLKFQETPPSSEPVTRSALKHENFTSFGLPATAKPLPYSSSTAYQTKDPIDYSSTVYKNPASPYTEPAYLKSGEKEYHKNYLGYGHPVPMEGQRLTPDRLRPTEGYSNPIIGSSPEGFAQYKATYGSKLDSYAAEPRTWDKYSGGYQDPIAKKEEEKISRDQKNRRSNGGEFNEEDEVEVVYQINEHGYLMDEDGNFIYDDQGEMIKLNEKQIQRLRENNLLEEEHTVAH